MKTNHISLKKMTGVVKKDVSTEIKCFAKTGFANRSEVFKVSESIEEDADDDISDLVNIDKATCDESVNNWDQPGATLEQINDTTESESSEDEEDLEEYEPCSINECLEMARKLRNFALSQGNIDMFEKVIEMNDILESHKLSTMNVQKTIKGFLRRQSSCGKLKSDT